MKASGHVLIKAAPSWWTIIGPHNFTRTCAEAMHAPVLVDDVSDREVSIIQARADVLATVTGFQQARSNAALRSAIVLSK